MSASNGDGTNPDKPRCLYCRHGNHGKCRTRKQRQWCECWCPWLWPPEPPQRDPSPSRWLRPAAVPTESPPTDRSTTMTNDVPEGPPPLGQKPGEVEQGRDGGLREKDSLGTVADIAALEAELDADELLDDPEDTQ